MREKPDSPKAEETLLFLAIRALSVESLKRGHGYSLQKEQRTQALVNGAPSGAPACNAVVLAATARIAGVAVMVTEMASPLAAQPGS